MIILIFLLSCGIVLGWISRKLSANWINPVLNILIYILLFILGLEVGANDKITKNFYNLGMEALLIAAAGLLGSMLVAMIFQKWIINKSHKEELTITPKKDPKKEDHTLLPHFKTKQKKIHIGSSVTIILWFILGVVVSLYKLLPLYEVNPQWGFIALCTLIGSVGFSVGHDPMLKTYFKELNIKLFLLPVMTILGTLLGTFILGLVWHKHFISDYLAIGSGFGYYSLSSILITQYKSVELGMIALLANIIREMCTLLLAPLIVNYFGKLALISSGGATSMDTTLPIITQYAGKQYTGLSVMHGIICDFSVPFLVTIFCSF